MLIDEYIDGKNMYVKKTVDDINKTQKKLKSLLEDPTVVEFITEEENLKDLEKSKKRKEKEFQNDFQSHCSHPVFSLISCSTEDGIETDAYCVVCGKKLELSPLEKTAVFTELFKEEKLLARYRGESSETGLLELTSMIDSVDKKSKGIEVFRKQFYKFAQSKKIINKGELDEDQLAIEFFESFCFEGYQESMFDSEQKKYIK